MNRVVRYSFFVFFAVYVAYLMYWLLTYGAVFDTDEADHANAALEVYAAIKSLSLSHIVDSVLRQSFYPPLHSFVVTLSYFIFGPSFFASRFPSLVLIVVAAVVFARLIAAYELRNKLLAVGFGSLLLLCSPKLSYLSVLCMLEPLGILFFILLVYQVYRFENQQPRAVFYITFLTVLLCLSKYTFAAVCLPAVALTMLIARFQKRICWKTFVKHSVLTVFVLLVWFALIERESVYHFIFNQPGIKGGIFSEKNLLFYPRVFFRNIHNSWLIAILALSSSLYGAWYYRKKLTVQFCIISILVALFVFIASSENGSRHILFVMPCIWFMSALAFGRLPNRWQISLAALLVCLVSTMLWLPLAERKFPQHFEAPRNSQELYEEIANKVQPNSKILIRGLTDSISLEGLRWYLAAEWGLPYTQVIVDSFRFSKGVKHLAIAHQRNLALPWLDKSIPRRPLEDVLNSKAYDYYILVERGDSLRARVQVLE